jgi:hypothetical protein
MVRRLRSLAPLLVLSLILSACNAKQGVIDGIIGLQSAAIIANQTPGPNGQPVLSDADAVKVVRYTTQTLTVIQAEQSGWQSAVQTGWAAFLSDIPASVKTRLAAQIAVISGAVGAL